MKNDKELLPTMRIRLEHFMDLFFFVFSSR